MDRRDAAEAQGIPVEAGVPEGDGALDGAGDPDGTGADEALESIDGEVTQAAVEADHEQNLVRDLEELAARAGKADEYLELAQRTQADFENYRKRAAREAAAAQERGIAKLAKELLPAIDNLDRALTAAESAAAETAAAGRAAAETAAAGGAAAGGAGAGTAAGAGEAPAGDSQLASGIKLVYADVLAALARVGIEPFAPVGEPFDPQYHEAVAQAPIDGATPGSVVEVYQRGYRIGATVLRPARVLVAA